MNDAIDLINDNLSDPEHHVEKFSNVQIVNYLNGIFIRKNDKAYHNNQSYLNKEVYKMCKRKDPKSMKDWNELSVDFNSIIIRAEQGTSGTKWKIYHVWSGQCPLPPDLYQ